MTYGGPESICRAGIDTWALYGAEATYNAGGTANLNFGIVQNVTPNQKNSLIQVRGFKGSTDGRDIVKSLGGKFECGVSVEFQPQTFDWMKYVLGTMTGSGTAGSPYIYSSAANPPSMVIATAIDFTSGDDMYVQYTGSVANSCTIKCAMGEPVSATLEFMSATLTRGTTVGSPVALSGSDIFTFAGGSLEIPNGAALTNVIDSVEVSITNNFEVAYGIGSRTGKYAKAKARDYGLKFTLKLSDSKQFENFLGLTTGPATDNPIRLATITLKFIQTAGPYVYFQFTGVRFDEWATGMSYGELMNEDITGVAETLTVTERQV